MSNPTDLPRHGRGLGHWTPRIAPAITTTTVLIAARAWNAEGAEHSIGAAVLMGAFALGSGGLGVVSAGALNSDPVITGMAFSGCGAFAVAGVAAYSDGLALPVLLWLLATAAVYGVCVRYWREDRRADAEHGRTVELRHMDHRHTETVEDIRRQAAVETAEASAYARQLEEAWRHKQAAAASTVHPDLADLAAKTMFPQPDEAREEAR
jgi:hypothetical protein